MSHKKNINTILAQAGIKSDPATGALITPLHFSTTYQHPEFGQSTGFDYIRTKNPTRVNAEKTLAAIESAEHALVTSSGMSAIVLAFSIFPVGSKVLAVRDLYGGSFRWFNQMEQEGRFFCTYANSEEELVEGLKGEVDILYIETVGSAYKLNLVGKNFQKEIAGSLSDVLEKDVEERYFSPHQSFIVNRSMIIGMDKKKKQLLLKEGYSCPISRSNIKRAKKLIEEQNLEFSA